MRSHGLGPTLVAATGAALALVLTLTLPWYGAVPQGWRPASNVDRVQESVPRWLGHHAGHTAWDLDGPWAMIVAGLAVLSVLSILLCLAPAVETTGRALLQLCAVAVAGVLAYKLLSAPDGFEPRYGIFASALAAAAMLLTSQSVASARLRRRLEPPRRYQGARPPAGNWEQAHSYAPPGS